jgi:hypothetical protein
VEFDRHTDGECSLTDVQTEEYSLLDVQIDEYSLPDVETGEYSLSDRRVPCNRRTNGQKGEYRIQWSM